ncbi:MAG TPA: sensory rhodopsin transducer [Longimicrobiaceae bacterium]|nr:sensory rhodopsin transducer [Longimicrobiaceae bacterium]
MSETIGRRLWAIPDGYIPGSSSGAGRDMESHEAICILNAGASDARVAITVFFEDRDPVGPYRFTVPARRTHHLRVNDFDDPEPIPRATPYASVVESDVPIVVQASRLDTRQAENALLSTVAFAGDR